jgi:hypothetical protein
MTAEADTGSQRRYRMAFVASAMLVLGMVRDG